MKPKRTKSEPPRTFRPEPSTDREMREFSKRNGQPVSWLIKESLREGWPIVERKLRSS